MRIIPLLALLLTACPYQGRGTAAMCDSCSQTSDCTEGLFCGAAGQCTTHDCDTVGCADTPGWALTCGSDKICVCAPAGPDMSANAPDLGYDLSTPLDLTPGDFKPHD